MKQNLLEYVYVVSEQQLEKSGCTYPEYRAFALSGDEAEAWQNKLDDSASIHRLKERVEELDEYIFEKPLTREFPKSIFLIEYLEHDVWLLKGYLLCEQSAEALVGHDPNLRRHQILERINC